MVMPMAAIMPLLRCATMGTVLAVLGACVTPTPAPPVASAPGGVSTLRPWRTLQGGFIAPPGAAFGLPARPGTGAFVKLLAPTAIALRGSDVLIADAGSGRLWREDMALNTLTPIAGAPVTPGTLVAIGPDLSAWVLDGITRRCCASRATGGCCRPRRAAPAAASVAGFALADGGATLLVVDDSLGQWVEFRGAGGLAQPRSLPSDVRSADGVAVAGDSVFVLDKARGAVHALRRDGTLLATLGEGELKQPQAVAADRFARVFVVDDAGRTVKLLVPGREAQVFGAEALGVQQIGGIAVDERFLAVSDRVGGAVVIHQLAGEARP
ncbi:hypothetical protein FSC37_00845 [Piscinibacter aquaticus]|uniref:NHL repeat containing protein n=1 Tax=Piscinibacter aquaticus TaxID=392597 RepID=A0A5C6TXE6_9BURK|nr:hypothetical protein FSC37_00845 [Piscinibacter aquaticus]